LLLLVVFVGIGIVALIVPADSTVGRTTRILWGVVPISIVMWQFAYSHFEKHRLLVNRSRFWVTNPELTWGVTVELDVDNGVEAFRNTVSLLEPASPRRRRLEATATTAVWQVDGLTLRVAADVADDPIGGSQSLLRVEFVPAPRAFRSWTKLLRSTVFDFLEQVERTVEPTDRKYVAHVSFPGSNPYFGLFVANVSLAAVDRFEIDYFEHRTTDRDLIQVRAEEVRVVSSSAHATKELSLRYLALSPIQTAE
jgi:hypothetical protein